MIVYNNFEMFNIIVSIQKENLNSREYFRFFIEFLIICLHDIRQLPKNECYNK